jgi:cytochrome c-type biogenesis protein CcmH
LLVRERILAGDSNEEVVEYIVARYGEFVLLKPTTGGWNSLLWAAGPLMFVIALGLGIACVRRRSPAEAPTEAGLSDDERKRLDEILKGQ